MQYERDKFYAKFVLPGVSALKTDEKVWLMHRLSGLGMNEEAKSVLRQINLAGMSDDDLKSMGMFASKFFPEEDVLRYFEKMTDKMFATKARFDYYMSSRNRPSFSEKALAEIQVLKKDPKYAGAGLSWAEADLLRGMRRYEEAIKAYRLANRQPDTTWAVTDCLLAMKNYGEAIKNVQGLESVKALAPAASIKIADIYKMAGDKGKEIDQLRIVLRRYPGTGQSSQAHQRLESYGAKITGGVAVAGE
jgi:tetratricopeptide (TPR) repeat protein